MSKHTPGAWKVNPDDPYEIVSEDYGGIANVPNEPAENAAIMVEMRANACLIAAAPYLRELLETVVNGIEDEWTPWFREPTLQDYEREWLEQARAALAGAGEADDG